MTSRLLAFCIVIAFICSPVQSQAGLFDELKKDFEKLGDSLESSVGDLTKWGNEQFSNRSGGTNSLAPTETNQNNLKVYSGENRTQAYVLEGTLYGAAAAGAVACGINLLSNKNCLKGAGKYVLGGAAVGALGGYLVASREEKARIEAEELDSKIDKARIELAEATVATEAARELTYQRTVEISRLKKEAAKSSSAKSSLRKELNEARGDVESMRKSSKRMRDEIRVIEANRKSENDRGKRDEYAQIISELEDQRDELDDQIDTLDGVVEAATV